MICIDRWKPYRISDLFDPSLAKGDCQLSKLIPGDIPLVTAGFTNQGIAGYIACGDEKSELIPSGTITVDMFGNSFYRDFDYYCVSHGRVIILTPKIKLNYYSGTFISVVIQKVTKEKYSFARMCSKSNLPNEVILLPTINDEVDTSFMEDYIKSLDIDERSTPDYFLDEGFKKACWYLDNVDQYLFEADYAAALDSRKTEINNRKWDFFSIKSIIPYIENGKQYNAADLVVAADGMDYISYVTRTNENNGISMYVEPMEYDGLEKANAITIGDTTATIFYQDHDFITGPHIIVLRADWLNVYTASFIITLLNQEKYRYPVFGRAFTKDLIAETKLYLPVDDNGNPDYQFMEDYIKSLPFSKKIG